jgi:hypothetical protein
VFKRETIDTSTEKDIITSAIVSTGFLENTVYLLRNLYLIKDTHSRRILSWCIDHYDQYKSAPGRLIYDIFTARSREIQDEKAIEFIDTILKHLNERYIENPDLYSTDYYTSKAKQYIEEQSLLHLSEEIKGFISTGKIDEAKRSVLNYNKIDKVVSTGTDPFHDSALISAIFQNMKKGLISFPYPALQELFKDMYRGDIVAVAGPAKRGKSFLMSQIGRYAMYGGLNVAEFSFEMGESVMGMRLYQNLLAQPKQAQKDIRIPVFDAEGNIDYIYEDLDGLDISTVRKYQQDFGAYGATGTLRFFDHNSCGRKVSDIADAIDRVEKYEGIKIDVVVIDYDVLLETETGFRGESYEAINQIWRDVKAKVAQDRDTLVIFGSQYNKGGAKHEVGPEEASGSSRKFDYVSHWVSILQTEAEKRAGIMRLDVVGRHDEFFKSSKVVCLQALAIGRPILDARWIEDIPNYEFVVAEQQKTIQGLTKDTRSATIKDEKGWDFKTEM